MEICEICKQPLHFEKGKGWVHPDGNLNGVIPAPDGSHSWVKGAREHRPFLRVVKQASLWQ
jgi:hypothetical protein